MKVLDIAKRIARAVSDPIPNSLMTNEDTTAQLLGYIEQGAINVIEDYDWNALAKSSAIITVAGQTQYDLPEDFDSLLTWGLYDVNEQVWLTAETMDESLLRNIDKVSGDSVCKYMILGRKLVFTYPITAGHTLKFFYKSKYYFKGTDESGNVVYRDTIESDTDEFVCDDNLLILAGIAYRSVRLQLADAEANMQDYLGLLEKKKNTDTAPTQYNSMLDARDSRSLTVARIYETNGGSY